MASNNACPRKYKGTFNLKGKVPGRVDEKEKYSLQRPPSINFGEGVCHRDQSGDLHKGNGMKRSQ
jgi:hypothetical protein